jgi:hypothetical protein
MCVKNIKEACNHYTSSYESSVLKFSLLKLAAHFRLNFQNVIAENCCSSLVLIKIKVVFNNGDAIDDFNLKSECIIGSEEREFELPDDKSIDVVLLTHQILNVSAYNVV